MSIDIGAKIKAIAERAYVHSGGTLWVRDVTLEMVGTPVTPAPQFIVAVTDATQWDQLQVGHVVTVAIHP